MAAPYAEILFCYDYFLQIGHTLLLPALKASNKETYKLKAAKGKYKRAVKKNKMNTQKSIMQSMLFIMR